MQLALFKQWGWDAHIERFDVLYPTPISTTLELVTPRARHARRAGAADRRGPELVATPPARCRPMSPTRATATSPRRWSTSITACPTIMTRSSSAASSVKGKIVIARYGGGWRGLKPKLAQEHGAVGCLIYSDPADDGYAEADVYPQGRRPARRRRPARLGRRHADLSRRPADARRRRDRQRQAPDPRAGEDHPQDPDAADLLRRRDADPAPRSTARWSPASGAAGCRSPITGAAPTRCRSTSRSSPTGR